EAVEVEVLADHQFLRELHQHALDRFQVRQVVHGQGHEGGRGQSCGLGTNDDVPHAPQQRQPVRLADAPGQSNELTDRDVWTALPDVDAFRGARVAVGVPVLLLHVEAAEVRVQLVAVARLEVPYHYALDRYDLASQLARRAGALHRVDLRRGGATFSGRGGRPRRPSSGYLARDGGGTG